MMINSYSIEKTIGEFAPLGTAGVFNGGKGSGNFGHAGRPGEVGGSAPEGTSVLVETTAGESQKRMKQEEIDSLADKVYSYLTAMRQSKRMKDQDAIEAVGAKMGTKHIALAKKLLDGDIDDTKKAEKLEANLKKEYQKVKDTTFRDSKEKHAKLGVIEAKIYALAEVLKDDDVLDKYR